MSLFDVLRYPISDRPLQKEIDLLPIDIREDLHVNLQLHSTDPSCAAIYLRIMLRQPAYRQKALNIIKDLRQAIRDLP